MFSRSAHTFLIGVRNNDNSKREGKGGHVTLKRERGRPREREGKGVTASQYPILPTTYMNFYVTGLAGKLADSQRLVPDFRYFAGFVCLSLGSFLYLK
jgi:hypothetical protein